MAREGHVAGAVEAPREPADPGEHRQGREVQVGSLAVPCGDHLVDVVACGNRPAGTRGKAARTSHRRPGTHSRSLVTSPGSFSRPETPFHAMFTTCVMTCSLLGLRTSAHHSPVSATIPTSMWAYIGASAVG